MHSPAKVIYGMNNDRIRSCRLCVTTSVILKTTAGIFFTGLLRPPKRRGYMHIRESALVKTATHLA